MESHIDEESDSTPDQIAVSDCHSDEGSKKRYFFANWLDIAYLFDAQVIGANLYLGAHGDR